MSWSTGDLVELWVAAGGGTACDVKYRVNGGAVTTLSTGSPTAFGAITVAGALDLLCNGTSNQFTAWVRRIRTFRSDSAPSWAR
jgi:hypothetical protein